MLKSTFTGLQRCRWQYWYIFIRLAVVASQICEIPWKSRAVAKGEFIKEFTVVFSYVHNQKGQVLLIQWCIPSCK